MTAGRQRLDALLVARGLFPSRQRAQAAVMERQVVVNGRVVDKPGTPVAPDSLVAIRGTSHPYASRGGLKLEHALRTFGIDPVGWVVADIGASTGGFTDCWLVRGAARVYSIDVGRGQLIQRLANDPRVTVRDRVNARYLTPGDVNHEPLHAVSIDVSFIGLGLILPPVRSLLAVGGQVVALVKPQFEAGPRAVGKGGIVRDPAVHQAVLERVRDAAARVNLLAAGLTPSPVRGRDGNREFLLWLTVDRQRAGEVDIPAVVRAAWEEGGGR